MPVIKPALRKALWHVAEVLKVIRLLRGPLLASTAAAITFYLPDQIRELYRITAADRDWREILVGICALTAMFVIFWWVSFELVQRFGHQINRTAVPARSLLAILPSFIGALPLVACALGLRAAIPGEEPHFDKASPLYYIADDFNKAISITPLWIGKAIGVTPLSIGAIVLVCLALMLAIAAYWLQRNRRIELEAEGRHRGFFSVFGLGVSFAIFFGIAVVVYLSPIAVPQAIGTLPLVALFFIALVLVFVELTFSYEMTGVPFMASFVVLALVFAARDWNDNHVIKAVGEKTGAPLTVKSQMPADAWKSFQAWFEARPGKRQFEKTFPVYIVAAQGGGIYAAYHTAILLSRLQDYCPEFRNHLFAISSVSGGSLGAAVFASVTKALAQTGGAQVEAPCRPMEHAAEAMTKATGAGSYKIDVAGPHEQAAQKILASNFLAPLAAGTLFPDFIQRFLFFSVPAFDRARWLEAAFEGSWQQAAIKGANPLEESVLNLWSPDGAAPALLINTTEVDLGRRLVISPFQTEEQRNNSEVLQFPLWDRNLFQAGTACHGLDVSLSTAVSLSARFPWLTPAGSLTTDCREHGAPPESRVVDGGYFDNSGVDTALDVISQINSELAKTDHFLSDPSDPSKHNLRIEIHLIVLNTGGFAERGGYGLGDALEPIRALLSTRVARTPIAINRARRQLDVSLALPAAADDVGHPATPLTSSFAPGASQPVGEPLRDQKLKAFIQRVHQARFRDPIYTLPLGWRISEISRDIIERQSGRFWECNPDLTYNQRSDQDFSNADCIQLMIYHQLNETLDEELKQLEKGADWIEGHKLLELPYPRLRHKDFENCYLRKLFGNVIAAWRAARSAGPSGAELSVAQLAELPQGNERGTRDANEPILRLWDANPQMPDEWLAYILAIYGVETGGVARRERGCLSDKCVHRLDAGGWDFPLL